MTAHRDPGVGVHAGDIGDAEVQHRSHAASVEQPAGGEGLAKTTRMPGQQVGDPFDDPADPPGRSQIGSLLGRQLLDLDPVGVGRFGGAEQSEEPFGFHDADPDRGDGERHGGLGGYPARLDTGPPSTRRRLGRHALSVWPESVGIGPATARGEIIVARQSLQSPEEHRIHRPAALLRGPRPATRGPMMSIQIDRTTEPWVGSFEPLGRVRVHHDGRFEIDAHPDDDEPIEIRERALRWGWAEPLAAVRRGARLIAGTALVPPLAELDVGRDDETQEALVLVGPTHDVSIAAAMLLMRDWRLIADRPVPAQWARSGGGNDADEADEADHDRDVLMALPVGAPFILSQRRAERLGISGTPVRDDSDALEIDAARITRAAQVSGIVHVSMRAPDAATLEPLLGFDRMTTVSRLFLGGALLPDGPTADPAAALGVHLRLAEIPAVRLRLAEATVGDDVDALAQWWHQLMGTTP